MAKADELRKILKKEYGISSDTELAEAVCNMVGVNIELFVPPCSIGSKKPGIIVETLKSLGDVDDV